MEHTLTTAWRSPSNIAIIKYWGKHGNQLPINPSVSITLSQAYTETKVSAQRKSGDSTSVAFLFEGKEAPAFAARIEKYIGTLSEFLPFLHDVDLTIESSNAFPHSSGIASSASAMSALALCLADLQMQYTDAPQSPSVFFQQVSLLSRLGSGSACRSVIGPVMAWGETDLIPGSSDVFAVQLHDLDPVFHTMRDAILIVDDGIKSVSSSAGHALMQGHPFGAARLSQVKTHLADLLKALRSGDLEHFTVIAEAEALTLHALMMTSANSYVLMTPNTIQVMNHVRAFRRETGIPVCFTLDAGPNVHLLYPDAHHARVQQWIEDVLLDFCKDRRVIYDQAGHGPVRL